MHTPQDLPDFVFVHGAFSDASVWKPVTEPLIAAGAKVSTIDLPSHTAADTARAGRTTFDNYVARAHAAVAASAAPVVLVGHSLGGMTITQVAEQIPEKIAALVYVCAFLPENGRSANSYAQTDADSLFGRNFKADPDHGIGTMTREALIETVFSETPEATRDPAVATILPEALQPFGAEVETTSGRFGSIARYYVATSKDHAITPKLQREMIDALPCANVYTVDADHMPMMSATRSVVEALIDVRSRSVATV